MNRVGREPAEDVKKRLVHSCRSAGLEVSSARMYLRKDERVRLIMVTCSPLEWTGTYPMISVFTLVNMDGEWNGQVDIRCSVSDGESPANVWDTLVMQGRNGVPFEDLVRQLRLTLEEREQVIAAIKLGVEGPYRFGHARWETPALMP